MFNDWSPDYLLGIDCSLIGCSRDYLILTSWLIKFWAATFNYASLTKDVVY